MAHGAALGTPLYMYSISISQKMNLSIRQVADKIYLPGWEFYLSWTTGQPLMLHPGLVVVPEGIVTDRFHCIYD